MSDHDINFEIFSNGTAKDDEIESYLEYALWKQPAHPLFILRKAITTVFTASYTGSGCHPALLPSALKGKMQLV